MTATVTCQKSTTMQLDKGMKIEVTCIQIRFHKWHKSNGEDNFTNPCDHRPWLVDAACLVTLCGEFAW